jgi:hypothetical protein
MPLNLILDKEFQKIVAPRVLNFLKYFFTVFRAKKSKKNYGVQQFKLFIYIEISYRIPFLVCAHDRQPIHYKPVPPYTY